MIIENIKSHEALKNFLVEECCENDVSVSFHPDVLDDSYIIIKIDDFYNSLKLGKKNSPFFGLFDYSPMFKYRFRNHTR